MKRMTLGEAETKRQQAVEFLRRVGKATPRNEFDDINGREYAEHRGAEIVESPIRRTAMARKYTVTKTKADLEDELSEVRDYIEQLEGRLDDIVGVANGEEDEEDSEELDSEADDEDEDDED